MLTLPAFEARTDGGGWAGYRSPGKFVATQKRPPVGVFVRHNASLCPLGNILAEPARPLPGRMLPTGGFFVDGAAGDRGMRNSTCSGQETGTAPS